MPANPLTLAHIEAQARLRALVSEAVARTWDGLGSYDEDDVDRFLTPVVPLVLAGQRQSVALTNGYIARFIGTTPLRLSPDDLTGAAVRNGAEPREVYRRPFVNVWTALQKLKPYEDAVAAGRARAMATAEMDIQLSMRETARAFQRAY